MSEKIKSVRTFSSGVSYIVSIDVLNTGLEDNDYRPTTIKIQSDNAQLELKSNINREITIKSIGIWESSVIPEVFKWIGSELEHIYQEYAGDENG